MFQENYCSLMSYTRNMVISLARSSNNTSGFSNINVTSLSKDLFHDAMIKILLKHDKIPIDDNERIKYMKTVIKNTVLDYLRTVGRQPLTADVEREQLEAVSNIKEGFPFEDILDILDGLIQESKILTKKEVVLWDYLYEFTPVKEIAVALKSTPASISSQTSKLRRKLNQIIDFEELKHEYSNFHPVREI